MGTESRKPPFTGATVPSDLDIRRNIRYYQDVIGGWACTERVARAWFAEGRGYFSEHLELKPEEKESLSNYAISRIWEAARLGHKSPLFMTLDGKAKHSLESLQEIGVGSYTVETPEGYWAELQATSYDDKIARTLRNLGLAEEELGAGVLLPVQLDQYPGGFLDLENFKGRIDLPTTRAILFAAREKEGLLFLQDLAAQGLINPLKQPLGTRIHITPSGYREIAKMQAGKNFNSKKAFMVCRFIDEVDEVYTTWIEPACRNSIVACPIARVKDVHHVDRVDDKIMQMIREATVVVVDLTQNNFNVGFEAGYALALKKPIVWTMRRPQDDAKLELPFDIQSHNILLWEKHALQEFQEELKYRMLAALDKARDSAA